MRIAGTFPWPQELKDFLRAFLRALLGTPVGDELDVEWDDPDEEELDKELLMLLELLEARVSKGGEHPKTQGAKRCVQRCEVHHPLKRVRMAAAA